jgi:hypothetical protein
MTVHSSLPTRPGEAASEVACYGPLLAALIAAKHELAFTCAWWAGSGPTLDASIALAGMALEEEGHARVLERIDAAGTAELRVSRDHVVRWDRWPSIGDTSPLRSATWPEALGRQVALDLEVAAVLGALAEAPVARLAACAARMLEEEETHTVVFLQLLAEARARAALTDGDAAARIAADGVTTRPELVERVAALVALGALPAGALERLHAHVLAARAQVRSRLETTP